MTDGERLTDSERRGEREMLITQQKYFGANVLDGVLSP